MSGGWRSPFWHSARVMRSGQAYNAGMQAWHEDPRFWDTMAPWLFPARRMQVATHEVDWVLERLKLTPPARVLDLCCGPGRHAVELAKRGYQVTGVDRTPGYLSEARRRANEAGVEVEWIEADMRSYQAPERYDAVVNLFTSFGYFDDPAQDLLVLQHQYRSLKPGGQLLVDLVGKEVVAAHFEAKGWEERDGTYLLQERRIVDDWTRIHNRWIVVSRDGAKEYQVTHLLYAGNELAALVRVAGFADVSLFGDLTGRPYDQNAERLVVVARK